MDGADRCQVNAVNSLQQVEQDLEGVRRGAPTLDQCGQGGILHTAGRPGDAIGQGRGGLLEPQADAAADLGGRGAGERHHQDRVDGAPVLSHLAQHAMAEGIGFAGTGTGFQHQGAAGQLAVEIQRADHSTNPPAARASLRGSSTRRLSSPTWGCCSQCSSSGVTPPSSCSRACGQR